MATFVDMLADKKTYADDLKITMADGVETTLGELRGGWLRQQDYTQKTMSHAREREDFAREKAQFEHAKTEAERTLAEMAQRVVASQPHQPQTLDEVESILQRDPVSRKLMEKISALDARIAERDKQLDAAHAALKQHEQAFLADQHRRVLAHLKSQDADMNEAEVVQYAQQNYIPRLDLAYRLMTEERRIESAKTAAAKAAEEKAYERAKRELAAPPSLPNRRTPAPRPADAPKTLDEAWDAAASDPEIAEIAAGLKEWSR